MATARNLLETSCLSNRARRVAQWLHCSDSGPTACGWQSSDMDPPMAVAQKQRVGWVCLQCWLSQSHGACRSSSGAAPQHANMQHAYAYACSIWCTRAIQATQRCVRRRTYNMQHYWLRQGLDNKVTYPEAQNHFTQGLRCHATYSQAQQCSSVMCCRIHTAAAALHAVRFLVTHRNTRSEDTRPQPLSPGLAQSSAQNKHGPATMRT